MSLDEALVRAYESRADYRQKQALVGAAEAAREAAAAGRLPSLYVNADYGAIGPTLGGALPTFSVSAAVRVPIFEGDATRGRIIQADAMLRQQRAELADLKVRIDYEVRAALLDLKAVEQQLQTAESRVALADRELTQATDRFKAGVTDNLEVVDAQSTLAAASESRIAALYAYNAGKAALARALGVAEEQALRFLGESPK
jgi:outer membrane protein TolC